MGHSSARRYLALSIATYRRAELLRRLLEDLAPQTLQPQVVFVVDGEPQSGRVPQALRQPGLPASWTVVYVPSNHPNLAYQRYLGWRTAAGCEWLLYLDDDLRLRSHTALEKVLTPLGWSESNVIAVTADVQAPDGGQGRECKPSGLMARLVERFGSGRRIPPGGLAPSGHRRAAIYRGQEYEKVEWLRGAITTLSRQLTSAPEPAASALWPVPYSGQHTAQP
jgi:hypothetical protein